MKNAALVEEKCQAARHGNIRSRRPGSINANDSLDSHDCWCRCRRRTTRKSLSFVPPKSTPTLHRRWHQPESRSAARNQIFGSTSSWNVEPKAVDKSVAAPFLKLDHPLAAVLAREQADQGARCVFQPVDDVPLIAFRPHFAWAIIMFASTARMQAPRRTPAQCCIEPLRRWLITTDRRSRVQRRRSPTESRSIAYSCPAPRISSRSDTGRDTGGDTGGGGDPSRNVVPSPTAAPAAHPKRLLIVRRDVRCGLPTAISDSYVPRVTQEYKAC
jgi:hypothetical protein